MYSRSLDSRSFDYISAFSYGTFLMEALSPARHMWVSKTAWGSLYCLGKTEKDNIIIT